jgi:hypothetical protein
MSPSKVPDIVFDKFYNVVDGKQRSAETFRNGVNPATKAKLWDVCYSPNSSYLSQ